MEVLSSMRANLLKSVETEKMLSWQIQTSSHGLSLMNRCREGYYELDSSM